MTEHSSERQEFQQQFGRIEELIGKLEKTGDPAARATAKELVQLLMEIHGAGLERLLEITSQSGAVGMELIDRFGQDEVTRNLLFLYGLHPIDLDTRVAAALETVRPYLRSRDANVELISIAGGVVNVRLNGSAHGCTASTLKTAIEEALYKEAPDLVSVVVETETAPAASVFVPLGELRMLNATGR
jgi:Fe-S cluster biogenesis protein NfuA